MHLSWLLSRGKPSSGQRITTSRRKATVIVASAALAFSGALFLAPSAQAVHELNLIELDGNAVTNNAAFDDWDSVCKAVTITNDTTSSIPDQCASAGGLLASNTAVAWANDGAQNATIFTGGGSKDPLTLTGWQWKDQAGGLPDKDNLQDAFAARYSIPKNTTTCPAPSTAANCEVLFFGSDRFDNSGDAQQGFWFFQNKVTLDPATGKFVGVHKNGDLLILSDFSNGGQVSTINIYKWTGTDATGGLTFLTGGSASKCGGGANDAFCGIVNAANGTTSPWSFTDKSGNSTYLNGEFYEGGVNLSDPSINLGGECFSSFTAETRSSTSTTATLKDFVLGQFALCSASLTTTPSGGTTVGTAVLPGTAVTDLAVVQGQGTSSPPTPAGNVSFFLCGPSAADSTALCTTGGTAAGVKALAATPPPAGEASATSDAVNTAATPLAPGRYCFRAEWPGDANYPTPLSHAGTAAGSECFFVADTTSATSAQVWLPNDSATITSAGGTALNGTLSFTLYSGDNCGVTSGSILRAAETFSLTNAASPATRSTTNSAVTVSTSWAVSWLVEFTSSNALVGNSSHCEKTTLTITN